MRVAAVAIFIFGLVLGFQNCGSAKPAPGAEIGKTLMVPVNKSITQISIPVDDRARERAELRADGSVVNLQTGVTYSLSPSLRQEISEAIKSAEICEYKIITNPDEPRCMALALPHAFATTDDGSEIWLSVSICQQDTFDLCQSSRDHFAKLVYRIHADIQAPPH